MPGRLNRQQILPLLQTLALPIYWLTGREVLGLGTAASVAFMLAAPLGMHWAVLGLGFIVSWLNRQERQDVARGHGSDWLIAYAREAAVSIRQFYWLMPFRERFRVPEPLPPLQDLPLILIHGYGCNRGLWLPTARWFSRRGYRVSAISLHPLHCSIDHYVQAIADEVARVRADSGASCVALICHSMGGLAARCYLQRCAELKQDPQLAALVTLATPHRGTHIARAGMGENARQMRYGAPWLETLGPHEAAEGSHVPGACRLQVTTIASLHDNIVSRPLEQRLQLPGARAIFVRRQGHMSLATSVRVLRILDRLLRRAGTQSAKAPCPPPVDAAVRSIGEA